MEREKKLKKNANKRKEKKLKKKRYSKQS